MKDKDPLDIPDFLKRDAINQSEITRMSSDETQIEENRPAKTVKPKAVKANGHDKAPAKAIIKATGKPKAKKAGKVAAKAAKPPKAVKKAAKATPKAKAAKPRSEPLEKDAYGFRKGSHKSKAIAMYARKNGATLDEVQEVVGSVQLNCLKALEEEGYVVERNKEKRAGARPITRYILKPKK